MANLKHLKILKHGVREWNQWREANPGVQPDLRWADFSEADLREVNLSEANLEGANFSKTNLTSADLSSTNLFRAIFTGANLREADLRRTKSLTWEQIASAFIDEQTKLPPEITEQQGD